MTTVLSFVSLVLTWGYAWVFFALMRAFLPLRGPFALRVAAFLLCGWLCDAIIYAGEWHSVFFTMAVFLAFLLLFWRGTLVEKVSVLLLFYPVLVAVNFLMTSLSTRAFYAWTGAYGADVAADPVLLFESTLVHTLALSLRLLFWLGIWALLHRALAALAERLDSRTWLMVDIVILAASVSIFTIICFAPADSVAYPICAAAIVGSLGSMLLVTVLVRAREDRDAARERDYLQARIADETRLRQVYHDLKNHLLLLGQGEGGAAQAMAADLRRQIEGVEDYLHTGNTALDVILRDKARLAREKQIDFNAVVHFQDGGFIAPLDLSSIFGNALDNAIEASEKLPPEARLITVKAAARGGMLVISVENNMAPGPLAARTSKDDAFLHGLGLASIRRAVNDYGGSVSVRAEEGVFRLHIMIPIP